FAVYAATINAMAISIYAAAFKCDVRDPDHFPSIHIDDLLVEQVPANPQHVLVGVIGCQILLAQPDSIERNRSNLVVADGQPGPAATDQKTVDPRRMDQWHQGGVAHTSDTPALYIENRKPQQFG